MPTSFAPRSRPERFGPAAPLPRRGRERYVARWRRLQSILLLLGWLFATGTHWDLVQVAAWARMWVMNAQVEPVGRALATTFTPEAMCSVCKTVQQAKTDQAAHPMLGFDAAKPPLLLPMPRALVISRPGVLAFLPFQDDLTPAVRRPAPPVPPPRSMDTAV